MARFHIVRLEERIAPAKIRALQVTTTRSGRIRTVRTRSTNNGTRSVRNGSHIIVGAGGTNGGVTTALRHR